MASRSKAKNINYFSVSSVDLRQVAGSESSVFNNDYISIVLNGHPSFSLFLRAGQVYQLAEPRLMLVLNGYIDVHLNLEQFHVGQGTAILTMPDTIMEITHFSDETTLCGIALKDGTHVDESIVTTCSPKDFDRLHHMLFLLNDMAKATPFRRDVVHHIVMAMISDIQYIGQFSRNNESSALPSRGQQIFQLFKELVNQHCEHERNIPFYADQLHITPHHLSAVISKTSGHSVMYWINRAVILRAKVMLRTSDLMTYEVAERLNFPNTPAFNNFFKRETGITPRAYRNDIQ